MSKSIFITAEGQSRTLTSLALMVLALGAAMLASAGIYLVAEAQTGLMDGLAKGFAVAAMVFALISMIPWLRSRAETCPPEVEGFLNDVAKRSLSTSWFFTLAVVFLVLGRVGVDLPADFYKNAVIGVMMVSYGLSFIVIKFRDGA
ncbi:MAG: hypothetical protein WD397_01055 [Wenzhouxiangellaceae bacterium]